MFGGASLDPNGLAHRGQKRKHEDEDDEDIIVLAHIQPSDFLNAMDVESFLQSDPIEPMIYRYQQLQQDEDPVWGRTTGWGRPPPPLQQPPYPSLLPDSTPSDPSTIDQSVWQLQPMDATATAHATLLNLDDLGYSQYQEREHQLQPSTSNQNAQYYLHCAASIYGEPGTSAAEYEVPSSVSGAPSSPSFSGAEYAEPSSVHGAPPLPTSPEAEDGAPFSASGAPRSKVRVARRGKVAKIERVAPADNTDTARFTEAVSHITLFGRNKITVSVGEVRRRMGAPEYQDWKMIARVTRTAKTKYRDFETTMLSRGFDFVEKKGERSCDSTLSMLMEADALTLAKDFHKLLSSELQWSTLGSIAAAAAGNQSKEMADNADGIINHLSCVKEYLRSAGQEPGTAQMDESSENQAVHLFSLETHGFGPLAVVAVIDSLMMVVNRIKQNHRPVETELAPLPDRSVSAYAAAAARRGSSESGVDYSLLHQQLDDLVPFGMPVLPRIGHDVDSIQLTRGEVRRRIYGPERMTASHLMAFLRKTKMKNIIADVRKECAEVGITVNSNAKKDINGSSWSSLCEKESVAMAVETAAALARLPHSQPMRDAAAADPLAAAWLRYITASIGAAMARVGAVDEQPRVESQADLHILRFTLLTHHFGHKFYSCVLQWLQNEL